jgi:hypothetical protein
MYNHYVVSKRRDAAPYPPTFLKDRFLQIHADSDSNKQFSKFFSRSLDLVYAFAESEVHLHDHNDKRGAEWTQNHRIKASQILDLTVPTTIPRSPGTGKDWRPIDVPVSV